MLAPLARWVGPLTVSTKARVTPVQRVVKIAICHLPSGSHNRCHQAPPPLCRLSRRVPRDIGAPAPISSIGHLTDSQLSGLGLCMTRSAPAVAALVIEGITHR